MYPVSRSLAITAQELVRAGVQTLAHGGAVQSDDNGSYRTTVNLPRALHLTPAFFAPNICMLYNFSVPSHS